MTLSPGVEVTLLFHATLVAIAATAILMVGSLLAPPQWVGTPDAPSRWTAEALELAAEVRRTLVAGETLPYDRVQRGLLPLSSRLDRHAEIAPRVVDDRLVVAVTDLAIGCRVVGMELTRAQRLDWDAPGSDVAAVRAVAERLLDELGSGDGADPRELDSTLSVDGHDV